MPAALGAGARNPRRWCPQPYVQALLDAEAAPALTAAISAHVSRPEITQPAIRALRNICVSHALQACSLQPAACSLRRARWGCRGRRT